MLVMICVSSRLTEWKAGGCCRSQTSMFGPTAERVSSVPLNGYPKYSPAWLNNPRRAEMGQVEPHFNPCVVCDVKPRESRTARVG